MYSPLSSVSHAFWSRWQQWLFLILLSIVLAGAFEWLNIPAALMLGPLVGGICLGLKNCTIQVDRHVFNGSKAVIGCMVAATLSPDVLLAFVRDGWIFLLVIGASILASSFLGWGLTRMHVLPGTTAVWGTTPGAASTMVVMAEAFGSDARLVAFMQYLRVLFVAVGASMVAGLYTTSPQLGFTHVLHMNWFPHLSPTGLGSTAIVCVIGSLLSHHWRIPAGHLLLPLLLGAVLQASGLVTLQLPLWLLAAAYAALGWHIGLGFNQSSLRHASKALPMVVLSILLLMAFCGFLGWILVREFGVDPLTAYLATSPGGLDSVAVIAASSSKVDMPFVMTLQTLRLLLVMAVGPVIARYMARHSRC